VKIHVAFLVVMSRGVVGKQRCKI